MSSTFQHISSKKVIFVVLVISCSYLLLRAIAFLQNDPVSISGSYFTFNEKKVRYVCKGKGEPYVFFETGFGSDSEVTWSPIVKELPENFTACYYDRLGYGGSDDVPRTFTTDEKSHLQESLIKHIAGESPVVLVAHSYGGIIARRTVARAKTNLVALILLDSAHENQHTVMRGKLDPISDSVKIWQYVNAAFGLSQIKNIFKEYDSLTSKRLDQYYSGFRWAHVLSTYRNEKGFYTPLKNFNYDFGKLKMLVISHDKEVYSGNPRFSSVTDDWEKMQKSISELSDNSERVIAKGATHNIPGDSPELVVSKVLETVELVSGNTG
ncbi:alpha/beta hydrolase [Alteromonas sp. 1_MG-2023]|uniref:alpha/beta hydrolase n=1 Tax=Alteromonas sp. 1_MG-2023 TaxID=3062669 RepID=UPI0026E3066B|nr:alpha/beta hydrolase [Alteromonas sp. 1_MG-2023]MDO6567725.1 alpha/beta hydrolase [Alteromonas sp. 1_MG-2023]